MISLPIRREGAASLLVRARNTPFGWRSSFPATEAKRRLASISPLFATALLTAAIFLLPPAGDRRQAQASVGDINAYATHIQYDSAATAPTARK
jgi:nitrate reductase gamma subunit